MRIVAGQWRGRTLAGPGPAPGTAARTSATRPTSDRVRQALFDMLSHAPWADPWPDCVVLDAFAGTGALGLEALSRGAARAVFFEIDTVARRCLCANIAALGAASRSVVHTDAIRPPPAAAAGGCTLVFIDPPYRRDLAARALAALRERGWIATGALIATEAASDESPAIEAPPLLAPRLLANRRHGAAQLSIWRLET